jgi:hypothetical protein
MVTAAVGVVNSVSRELAAYVWYENRVYVERYSFSSVIRLRCLAPLKDVIGKAMGGRNTSWAYSMMKCRRRRSIAMVVVF